MHYSKAALSRVFLVFSALTVSSAALAQGTPLPIEELPLGKDIGVSSGQSVTPAYEGWYENEDGSLSVSFGYYNRNTKEVLNIPIGPANRIIGAPGGEPNQGQPDQFEPGRHWGVFTVRLPAGSKDQVVWHLQDRGETFHIPGNLDPVYYIDAIAGDASKNFPPELHIPPNETMGHGPAGVTAGPLKASVGKPLTVSVNAKDDGVGSELMALFLGGGGSKPPLDVHWFKQQGPGNALFGTPEAKVPVEGGVATTTVTFDAPGDYLLRARVNDMSGVENGGQFQCCWSNGFIKVTVSK